MEPSYLIQRLCKAYPNTESPMSKIALEFGGGLIRGGFTEKSYNQINKLFRFDYMGSSEFEWGAVPKSLKRIQTYMINNNEATGVVYICTNPVYYICNKVNQPEIFNRIKDIQLNKFRLKEHSFFDEALAARVPDNVVPEKKDKYKFALDYVGWIDIENDFMFFLDKEIFEKLVGKECP